MRLRTVDVLGGGPGGLFAARLIRRRFPSTRVVVHEQNALGTTFGFGIGLAAGTQRNIESADPEVHAAILAVSHDLAGAVFNVPAGIGMAPPEGVVGIERVALLRELSRLAEDVDVEIRYGQTVRSSDLTADLVIAADGVSSATRHAHQDEFGVRVDRGRGLYLWCGVDFALPRSTFESVTTEHGTFTIHAYPYAEGMSTFLVETDEESWRAAGLDAPAGEIRESDSDEASLAYLSRAFAATLDGRRLIGNRTRWTRFRTITCDRWFHENVVLLGDASHTAHYSIGSGTKLAMEDGISLVEALQRQETVGEALRDYDSSRRPRVETLQSAAARSQVWWDSFGERTKLPVPTLLLSYMTRSGRMDLARLSTFAPDLLNDALATYAGEDPPPTMEAEDIVDWVLDRPLSRERVRTSRRVVAADDLSPWSVTHVEFDHASAWSPEADQLLLELTGHDLALEVVWLSGSSAAGGGDVMIEFAERVKWAYPRSVVVAEVEAASQSKVASALVADRVDLVSLRGA